MTEPKPLRGQEWRDALKAAQSKAAKAARIQRGKYTPRHAGGLRVGGIRMRPGGGHR